MIIAHNRERFGSNFDAYLVVKHHRLAITSSPQDKLNVKMPELKTTSETKLHLSFNVNNNCHKLQKETLNILLR